MLKVGICGAGFMGGMHAACYGALPGVQVTAVADVRRKNAQDMATPRKARTFATAKDLIDKADIDIVDICLPTHLHAAHAIQAVKRGLPTMCEKPLARTMAQANAIVKAVRKAKVPFMVGQVIRFWPEYMALKKTIDKKTLGKLSVLSCVRVSPRPTWAWKNWLNIGAQSGGAVLDLHVHDADYVQYVLGPPKGLQCVAAAGRRDCLDYIFTNYLYPGMAVSAEGGWNMPPGFPFEMNFRAVFEKGTIFYSSLHTPMTLYRPSGKNSPIEVPAPKVTAGGGGGNISDLGGYFNEIQHFVNCVKRGREPATATVEDGRDAVVLALRELSAAARVARRR